MFMKPIKGKTSSSYGCKASNFNYIMFYLSNNSDEATTSGNYLFIFSSYWKTTPTVWMQASTYNETASLSRTTLPPCNVGTNLFHILSNQTCYLFKPNLYQEHILSNQFCQMQLCQKPFCQKHSVKSNSIKIKLSLSN